MRAKALIISLFMIIVLWGTQASAYKTMGIKWQVSDLPVRIYISNTLSNEMEDSVAHDAIWASFLTWQNVDCSYVQFEYGGRTAKTAWGVGDGQNVVSWRNSNWPDSKYALAVTSVLSSGYGNTIFDSDMIFNGVHHQWSVTGSQYRTDLIAVATHEAGHLIGLDHSNSYSATMYASTGPGMTHQRTLHDDDINGVCAIYPGSDAPNLPPKPEPVPSKVGDECTYAYHCNGGLNCVNDGSQKYCSQGCSGNTSCPTGYQCISATGGSVCVKSSNFAPEPKAKLGQTCSNQVACEGSLLCISDSSASYCTNSCASAQCPNGYTCVPAGTSKVCVKGTTTQPTLPKFGDTCGASNPCDTSLLCITDNGSNYCTNSCTNANPCPGDYECVSAGSQSVCVKKTPDTTIPTNPNPTNPNPTNPTNPNPTTPVINPGGSNTGGTTSPSPSPTNDDGVQNLDSEPKGGCQVATSAPAPAGLALLFFLMGLLMLTLVRRKVR